MKFNPAVLASKEDQLMAASWMKFPYYFLIDCCYTKDEVKAGGDSQDVVRLIPPLPHVETFCYLWQTSRLLTIVKSRRMICSWIACALELWLAIFTLEAHVAVIAQDQTGSEKFLARHVWLYNHLPELCPRPDMKIWSGVSGDPRRILFPETGSTIEAFPGSPDKIRGEGKTLIRCEEIAFWDKAEESWTAIMPVVQGGGRVVVISTPLANSWYSRLVQDTMLVSTGGR